MLTEVAKPKITKMVWSKPEVELPEERKEELLNRINMAGPCFFDCDAITARLTRCLPKDELYAEAYFLESERIRRGVSSISHC